MQKLFVLAEQLSGKVDDSAWELLNAARSIGKAVGEEYRVAAILFGDGVTPLADELATRFDDVYLFDDARFALPDGEVYAAAVEPLLRREAPYVTLIPHTNNGMDLAPGLSVKLGIPLIADCLMIEPKGDRLSAVRTVYGGKVQARVTAGPSSSGFMATVRPGAFAAPDLAPNAGTIHREEVAADLGAKRKTIETITPDPGEVDITQADKLVAVGRGIEEEENLEIVNSLAEALGAEVACSRPVVDKRWLAKSRQVGTSGVTVKPKVYIAVGISGSFQHLGGIKGGPYLVAINKDPRAPIFNVADVGIVGDLFDLVPLLDEKIREAKG